MFSHLNLLCYDIGSAVEFILTHFSTYGGVCSQMFSSQDVPMNYILHKGEIHQVGPVTAANKDKGKDH